MTQEQRTPDQGSPGQVRPAVIYARVSSKEQEREGFSMPAQLNLLRSYSLPNGLSIAQEFEDVETAKQAGRSGFGQMISFLKKNRACRVLVVEKTDRLYRNFRDLVTIDELGLEIHFVKENVVLSPDSRSSEKFMHGIKVLMAKNYIDNLSEETRKGMLEKARQGIWPSYAPLGFLNVLGRDGKRTIVSDQNLAPIVKRLYELYATGKHSLKDMVRESPEQMDSPTGRAAMWSQNRRFTRSCGTASIRGTLNSTESPITAHMSRLCHGNSGNGSK